MVSKSIERGCVEAFSVTGESVEMLSTVSVDVDEQPITIRLHRQVNKRNCRVFIARSSTVIFTQCVKYFMNTATPLQPSRGALLNFSQLRVQAQNFPSSGSLLVGQDGPVPS